MSFSLLAVEFTTCSHFCFSTTFCLASIRSFIDFGLTNSLNSSTNPFTLKNLSYCSTLINVLTVSTSSFLYEVIKPKSKLHQIYPSIKCPESSYITLCFMLFIGIRTKLVYHLFFPVICSHWCQFLCNPIIELPFR